MDRKLIKCGDDILRIIEQNESDTLIVNFKKQTMPRWVSNASLTEYTPYSEEISLPDIKDIAASSRKKAYERFNIISPVLPYISNKSLRNKAIDEIAAAKGISKQTIYRYVWLYAAYQNISALAPKEKKVRKELTKDEKNIRWSLNKYYYTRHQNTLSTVYTLMLKEKYCDKNGVLFDTYPSFYQFRYYYRKNKKNQNYFISRKGIKYYQRNYRPLLGDGIQEFAPAIGYGMLDSTVCDIYLINDSGGIVGRPILTACIDAYSGLCCGYTLSWEGGVYSLRSLMLNIIADKREWCRQFGIEIDASDWNCNKLPATLITDMGREYASETFEQITDLGATVINLPPYRPELKGAVEKFFDVVQNLYKPYLKDKGVIEPDFQERGIKDYRKDACLTIKDFEKVILYCIIHYNSARIIQNFPYTEKMIAENVQPFSSCIWNYGLNQIGANLITIDCKTLVLTLLPRTTGKFTRKGLVANGLRYKNDSYTEQYLKGGNAAVAYNPENVSELWIIENGRYTKFTLIESRFQGKDMTDVTTIKSRQKALEHSNKNTFLQARIDITNHISAIAENAAVHNNTSIKDIRINRKREQQKTHIDYIERSLENE